MEQEKTGLQFDQSPYYIRIKQDRTIEVYRELVIQGKRQYEKKGVIRNEVLSRVRGLVSHAARAAGHHGDLVEGRYGLTEPWGIKILLVATVLHGLKNYYNAHVVCSFVMDESPTDCEWWLGMTLRPNEWGVRAVIGYRIISGLTEWKS